MAAVLYLFYAIYVVITLPLAAVAAAVAYGAGLPLAYLYGLAQVLLSRPPELPPPTRQLDRPDGADPAVPQYFYGPALIDADHAVRVAYGTCQRFLRWGRTTLHGCFEGEGSLLAWPLGVGGFIGLALGTAAGAAVTAGWALAHLLTVGVSAGVVRTAGTALRLADSAVLRIRNIRMVCPDCYERVAYPGYECPNPDCTRRHRDVRPGRFGIVRRRCQCGTGLNTLLLFGSSRMNAFCPYCGRALAHHPGKAPEIVLPFFGATGAGKTRLLFAMVTQLQNWDRAGVLPVSFGDEITSRELSLAAQILRSQTATTATATKLPRSYVIRLSPPGGRRVLHMFDAAGELFYTAERTQELRYLSKARTFILVVDPLSVPAFWEQLPPGQQAELDKLRSTAPSPQLAYDQAHPEIEAMGVRLRSARLAVVFSRADLIEQAPVDIADWATEVLGLGNLVRSARLNFRETSFFFTAAVMKNEVMHPTIPVLLRWVLTHEGVTVPEPARLAEPEPAGVAEEKP
jgi:ribosomal protein S27E